MIERRYVRTPGDSPIITNGISLIKWACEKVLELPPGHHRGHTVHMIEYVMKQLFDWAESNGTYDWKLSYQIQKKNLLNSSYRKGMYQPGLLIRSTLYATTSTGI